MRGTQALGEFGERVAARHLQAQGMQVLAQRWRCRLGEIDVVAVDGACLVVCEVKTRRSSLAGSPFDAVTPAKLARLRQLTAVWLESQEVGYRDIRIDVVSVVLPRRGAPQVEHLRGVS